jgi:hypothetical protein
MPEITKPKRESFCHCGNQGIYMMFEGFVKTGKRLWYCQDHKPDFRALRVAYFNQHGHWPPVGKP